MKTPPAYTDISIHLNAKHRDVLREFIIYLIDYHSFISFSVSHTLAKVDGDNYHTITLEDLSWAINGSDILKKLSVLMDEEDGEE